MVPNFWMYACEPYIYMTAAQRKSKYPTYPICGMQTFKIKPYLCQWFSIFLWEKNPRKFFFLNHDKISAKNSETIRPIASIIQLMDFDSLKQAAKIYRNCTRNHSGIAHLLSRDKSFLFPTTLHNTHCSSRVLITTSCLHLSCLV